MSGYLQALTRLPLYTPGAVLQGRRLMVVVPHPDDESLGVGGLIAAARKLGLPVTLVFLTSGDRSHVGSRTFPPEALAAEREQEAINAARILGVPVADIHFLRLPDTGLKALSASLHAAVVLQLQSLLDAGGPTLLATTAPTDPHADHQASFELVHVLRRRPGDSLHSFPIWTWTLNAEDLPDCEPAGCRVDISAFMCRKAHAITEHRSQFGMVVLDADESFTLPLQFVAKFTQAPEILIHHD